MAGEQNPGSGTSVGGTGSGTSGAGTGVGGAVTGGAGGTGTQQPPSITAPGTGTAAPPNVVPIDVLPDEFKNKSAAEIKFLLKSMADGYKNLHAENQRLKAGPPAEPKPKESKESSKPVEERILEDAEGTIREVVEKLYGPTVAAISTEVSGNVYKDMRREYPDFAEVEADVNSILEEAGAPRTRANLELAYETAVGRRAIQTRRQQQAAALNQETPPPDTSGKPPIKAPTQGTLEYDIWQSSGMSAEEWHKYKNDDFEIKVPTGKKEAARA